MAKHANLCDIWCVTSLNDNERCTRSSGLQWYCSNHRPAKKILSSPIGVQPSVIFSKFSRESRLAGHSQPYYIRCDRAVNHLLWVCTALYKKPELGQSHTRCSPPLFLTRFSIPGCRRQTPTMIWTRRRMRITGNDIPDEIWRTIADHILQSGTSHDLYRLISVNRALFNVVLDMKYGEVRWTKLDWTVVRLLSRLRYVGLIN